MWCAYPWAVWAKEAKSTSRNSGVLRVCTCRIAALAAASGRGTYNRRSKRPGLSRAASKRSGRLVAASTTTPCRPCSRHQQPSLLLKSWTKPHPHSWMARMACTRPSSHCKTSHACVHPMTDWQDLRQHMNATELSWRNINCSPISG